MTTPEQNQPKPVIEFDLNEVKQSFMNEEFVEGLDPTYNRITSALEEAVKQHDEEFRIQGNHFLFDQMAFVATLEHVVKDQLSVLKKDKITPQEWAARFNRWLVFCETVINMGVTCVYSRQALEKEDYQTVFNTLAINKIFETTFLKPRGIKIDLVHKNEQIKNKYPWLAMPCLIIKDEQGEEHQIALTPGPEAKVWWLDVLASFHASFNWDYQGLLDGEGLDSSIDNPYASLQVAEEETGEDDEDDEK